MRPLAAAANLGDRYISDRYLPDKAIDLIDEAGSRVRLLELQAAHSSAGAGSTVASGVDPKG